MAHAEMSRQSLFSSLVCADSAFLAVLAVLMQVALQFAGWSARRCELYTEADVRCQVLGARRSRTAIRSLIRTCTRYDIGHFHVSDANECKQSQQLRLPSLGRGRLVYPMLKI